MVTSLSQIEETKDYDGATEFGNLGVTSVTLARAVPGTTGTGVGVGWGDRLCINTHYRMKKV